MENVNNENHQHMDEDTDYDYTYTYIPDSLSSELDEFLNAWRDELESKQTIFRLNEDCLLEIISYLPVNDLRSLSETCRDFQRLSNWFFEKCSSNFRLERTYLYDRPLSNLCVRDTVRDCPRYPISSKRQRRHRFSTSSNGIKLSDAKSFIRNFGQHLTKFSLGIDEFHYLEQPIRLLPLLDRYCTKLEDLTFYVTFSVPVNIIEYKGLSSNLVRLTIFNVDSAIRNVKLFPIEVDLILTHFVSLKHLELNGIEWIIVSGTHVTKRYEKLESLSLRNILLPRTDMFMSFLNENGQLKRLKLSSCFVPRSEENFTMALQNLESLWLQSRDNYVYVAARPDDHKMFLRFTNILDDISALKEVLIDTNLFQSSTMNAFLARLAAHNIVEHLSIFNNTLTNELVSHLCAMSTLNELIFVFSGGFNDEIMKKLACDLTNLTYVEFNLCRFDLNLIVNLLEYSHKLKTIALIGHIGIRNVVAQTMFSSMVNARLRNKCNNETLSLVLEGRIRAETLLIKKTQSEDFLLSWAHVIKVVIR